MIKWHTRDPNNKPYLVGAVEELPQGSIWCIMDDAERKYASDYKAVNGLWMQLDIQFDSIEDAKHWLETVYITGAWK
jgi:hypothetical protein